MYVWRDVHEAAHGHVRLPRSHGPLSPDRLSAAPPAPIGHGTPPQLPHGHANTLPLQTSPNNTRRKRVVLTFCEFSCLPLRTHRLRFFTWNKNTCLVNMAGDTCAHVQLDMRELNFTDFMFVCLRI
ncbi:Hypp6012 [Branchiostoma lanceolatum]|uniref:Hypp6012 protein n=1 Tax=Branchiostoma lanceolatum TaxID=7740 RepID=A0A8J9VI85_BRALA|nr:Hypp6012 [Branchiostoma lanceolatum]